MVFMISGVDEAGKGPVLGPMCVAGILLDGTKIGELSRIGVKDSKQLTAKKREVLAGEIKELAEKYFILEVTSSRIDELRKIMTMNEIMVASFTKVLKELRPDHAFVDAADVIANRFGENIRMKYPGEIMITSEHKADVKYPIVSAASILAKVQRDLLVKQIENELGLEIGSGYPSDAKTIGFLEQWVKDNNSLPSFARSSWETSKNIFDKFDRNQKRLFDYDI
ncbi:MAG: RNase HII [Candidatus Methanoperedens nitroreducens]|uniref:Ribonuclease HII n=1 Tax=Candidatus Methanoperedens nitratireducens TaxID=1392998 RepID=A0A0P8DVL1_9EURY|nr:ribonuclease HII [Candidatus Methanoperedens sp. BLZ2]KPQ41572.1 MAG: RNase HII [Candidatus Methanoperedens sp. BLZ1]MCX9079433.1 ribonuclease HII [Candidatus Methanoperedens sp.]MCX9088710.1 ribonuclease HII [Candidatus Methanoperedens sp.]CAG0961996.1 Ribonuclease HII [Methanosarcinales archaeon]